MPSLFYLVSKWWKSILVLITTAVIVVAIIVFLLPNKYLSSTTALPANPASVDRASVFNGNKLEWYTAWGTPDDIDKIVGTAQLDTVYLAMSDSFDLPAHYKVKETGYAARIKAAFLLRKDSRISKTEYGELKVRVWDTDKHLSPQIANAILSKLSAILGDLESESNRSIVTSLQLNRQKIKLKLDSLSNSASADTTGTSILKAQQYQFQKLQTEYELILETNPPVLRVVEYARPAEWPDKPRRVLILLATAFLSLLFGLFAALMLEKKKSKS